MNEEEANEVTTMLKNSLTYEKLKKMHASNDREMFVEKLMDSMFEEIVKKRHKINFPTEERIREEWKKIMKGVVLIH